MSKRRKYDIKNKRSFIIIVILSVLVVAIFSLFIYKYSKASKIEYKIESGSVLQDVDKNYLTIDDDAKLKIRWNGNYYLVYNDEKITLGKKVVVYNTITSGMKLYGTFYEIASDGKVIENKEESVLANTTDPKFYKIDDREYLLVANKISSEDYSIEATNYLLVELDKAGNAKLSNNKINLKTISPTTLVTSKYTFDINNEILNFGEYDIDLKKIIGSTNQYTEETDNGDNADDENEEPEDDNTPTGDNVGTGGAGSGGSLGTGNAPGVGDVVNNNDTGNITDIGELMDKVKMTSIIRIVEGLTEIGIDYVIYDPYNEYGDVYVEVVSDRIEVVPLSKEDTHLTLEKLEADKSYKLNFIYTTVKTDPETGEKTTVPYTFERFNLRTKKPEYSISVYRLSKISNTLEYRINLQEYYNISSINVNISFNYKDIDSGEDKRENYNKNIPIENANLNYVKDVFDISKYNIEANTVLELTVKSIMVGEREIPINSTYTFRFGGES